MRNLDAESAAEADPPSIEYFRRMLDEAAKTDPDALRRAAASLAARSVHIIVETESADEEFHLLSDGERISVSSVEQEQEPAVTVRVTPAVVRDILQGELTPVEAFFMGKLRARGTTRNLYAFQQFFIAVAQIGSVSPTILDIIDDFELRKR